MSDDCDIYGDVDFGRGPVEVRCTMKGPHMVHRCDVLLFDEQAKKKNVFDPGDPNKVKEVIKGTREYINRGRI